MYKSAKVILSILLSTLILLSAIPAGALTESDNAITENNINSSTQATAANPLAAAIADAMNDYNESIEECVYGISHVELDGMTVKITLTAPDNTTVIAAVYDEDTMELVTSGKAACGSDSIFAEVILESCSLPQYYFIKVFIVNGNLEPVSECFTERRYTREMQEFYSITVNDFDSEHIVYYHNNSNFVAVNKDAVVIYSDESQNILVSSDYENVTYTFSCPDESLLSLKFGDIMYVPCSDDIIVGTIEEIIENCDGTITICCKKNEDPLDLFDYIHIDTSDTSVSTQMTRTEVSGASGNAEDDIEKQKEYELKDGIEFSFAYPNKPTDIELPADWETKGIDNNSLTVDKKGLEEKIEFAFNGKLDFETSIEYCYYKKQLEKAVHYFDINMKIIFTSSMTANIGVESSFSVKFIDITVPTEVPGLQVFVRLVFTLKFSAKVSATGKLAITYYNNYSYENLKKINRPAPPSEMELSIDEELSINISVALKLFTGVDIAFGVVRADLYTQVTASTNIKPYTLCMDNKKIGVAMFNKNWSAYYEDEVPVAEHDCTICLYVPITITLAAGFELDWSLIEKLSETKARLDKVSSVKTEVSKELLNKVLRASLINDKWEFDWTDEDEKTCPHMRFLVKFTATNAFTQQPECYAPIKITFNENKSEKIYKGEEPVATKEIYTDDKGIATLYLPSAVYDFDMSNDLYKIISSNPSSKEIKVIDDRVTCTLRTNKAIYVPVCVKIKQTNVYVTDATITYNNKDYITNLWGDAYIYIFPYENAEFIVRTEGVTTQVTQYIPFDLYNFIVLEVDLGSIINITVVNKYNEPIQGAKFQTLSNITKTTDSNGQLYYYETGEIIYATVMIGDVRHNIVESVTSGNMDLTIRLPVGHMVQCIVKTEEGNPASGIDIDTYGKTDENGKAIIFLDTGDYTITVTNADGTRASADVSVSDSSLILKMYLKSHIVWEFDATTATLTVSGYGTVPICDDMEIRLIAGEVKNLVIKEGITKIGEEAFRGFWTAGFAYFPELVSVSLPHSLIEIDDHAFDDSKIETINIPNGVKRIGRYAFETCDSLCSLYIPSSVEEIDEGAFHGCLYLTDVYISEGVKSIGHGAFDHCRRLATISIPQSVTFIGYDAFSYTSVWDDSKKAKKDLYIDNCLISVFSSPQGTYTIKEGTRLIAGKAFDGCRSVTAIANMESVRYIGWFAFGGTDIEQVEIPEGTTQFIQGSIISRELKQVILPSSLECIYVYTYGFIDKSVVIYFRGTEEQWNNIKNVESIKCETIYFNYKGSFSPLPEEELAAASLFTFSASAAEVNDNAYTVNDAVIGYEYIIYAVRDENADNLLAPENLLFIDQQKATDTTLTFRLFPKNSENDFAIIIKKADILEVNKPKPNFTLGDVDSDGEISSADARLVLRASVTLETLDEIQTKAADVDMDDTVSSADARLILRASVDLEDPSGWGK